MFNILSLTYMWNTAIQQLELHFNHPSLTRFEPSGPTSEATLNGSKHAGVHSCRILMNCCNSQNNIYKAVNSLV